MIMPNFNDAWLISRSIDSVLLQTFRDLELIVVDDGSSDDSLAVVRKFEDKRIRLLQQDHGGVCAARNRGIKLSRGSYIAFLDSDDTWECECLERLHEALSNAPDAALAYCGWRHTGLGAEGETGFIPPNYETPEKLELLLRDSRWPIHAALTKRSAILSAGGFNPRYQTSEDFLLWLKIAGDHRIVRVPEVLAIYHHHHGSRATSNRLRMAVNHLEAQQEYLQHRPDAQRKLGPAKIRALTLGELLRRGNACYWRGDLEDARAIFRRVMKSGYGDASDWKRMLPALLPAGLHKRVLRRRQAPSSAGGDPA